MKSLVLFLGLVALAQARVSERRQLPPVVGGVPPVTSIAQPPAMNVVDERKLGHTHRTEGSSPCKFEACGGCHNSLAEAVAILPCNGGESGVSTVTIHTSKKIVVESPIEISCNAKIVAAPDLPRRPKVVGRLNGEPIFRLMSPHHDAYQRFVLQGFDIVGGKGTYTSGVRSEDDHPVQFEAHAMSFTRLRTRDGVNGAAVYIKIAHNMLIDQDCVIAHNTLGEKGKGCEVKGGPNSQYCKEGCTPVYGGGSVYVFESHGTASIGGTYEHNTVLFNHGQGASINVYNVTEGTLTVQGTFRYNAANEAGGLDIWQVNEGAQVMINGNFHDNIARDMYGYCGSRGGAVTVRLIFGQVYMDGAYVNNKAETHGGVMRTDKIFPGGKLAMSGVYRGNTAQFGNDVNLFFLYTGSSFSYIPNLVREEASGRSAEDVLYISRSTDCENKAEYPIIEIDGCTPAPNTNHKS